MARSQTTPSGKPDPTSASHTPPGVHSVIQMSPSPPEDEQHPNAMRNADGELFYPDTPEDAVLFNVHHGAEVVDPVAWPWPGVLTPAVLDVSHCPTPDTCFPYGVHPSWAAAACIHGSTGGTP